MSRALSPLLRSTSSCNIWHGGPPGRRTNRPICQVPGSQAAQSAPGRVFYVSREIRPRQCYRRFCINLQVCSLSYHAPISSFESTCEQCRSTFLRKRSATSIMFRCHILYKPLNNFSGTSYRIAVRDAPADRKQNKYSSLTQLYLFVPVAAETVEAVNKDSMDFLSDLERHITQSINDHRESAFLFQRLSDRVNSTLQCGRCFWVPSPKQPPRMKCSRSSICYSF